MTDPTPSSFPDDLTHALGAWVDARAAAAIPVLVDKLVAALVANEERLMLPLTAWANGWIQQIEQTVPPMIADAIKGVLPHWLAHLPEAETEEEK